MIKFKILETKRKQKIQEDKVRTFQDALQNLASLGSAFGINTSLLTTVSGMAGNIMGLINAFKKSPKSRGLNKNDLLLVDILKKNKDFEKLAGKYIRALFMAPAPTSIPEDIPQQEQQQEYDPETSQAFRDSMDILKAKQSGDKK